MGKGRALLTDGKPLSWDAAAPYRDYVLEHGVLQFLNIFHAWKESRKALLMWGDEIEYYVVLLDPATKKATLSLRGKEIMIDSNLRDEAEHNFVFHPEYGRFMVESTPGAPYAASLDSYALVESSMFARRVFMQSSCIPNEHVITLTAYPRMGCAAFTTPAHATMGPVARSLFTPDEAINAHPRFPTLTQNIRLRRGANVCINAPLFRDERTREPRFIEEAQFLEDVVEETVNGVTVHRTASGTPLTPLPPVAEPSSIYMDSMAFGMGCCCLQATFQARDLDEARDLYDQLTVFCPIMMALSAGAPAFRGLLADVDCRWNVIAASVDDRTEEERGLKPLEHNRHVIKKSRYGSVSRFISRSEYMRDEYNDLDCAINETAYRQCIEAGVDERLARHIGHLYCRDPLVIMEGVVSEVKDEESSLHFENVQSTNWQTCRFKPPTPGSPIGWRVEFRPMEIQLTDFENAAYAVMVVLLTRVILTYHLNLYIPLSKVDANIAAAQHRDAVKNERFYFRRHILPQERGADETAPPAAGEDAYELMTIGEIMNGSATFPGLLPLVRRYLDSMTCTVETRATLDRYVELFRMRSAGEVLTGAGWIRRFIQGHPKYNKDSVVTEEINYDLMAAVVEVGLARARAPDLVGDLYPASCESVIRV